MKKTLLIISTIFVLSMAMAWTSTTLSSRNSSDTRFAFRTTVLKYGGGKEIKTITYMIPMNHPVKLASR